MKTLFRRGHALADPAAQLRVLSGPPPRGVDDGADARPPGPAADFNAALAAAELPSLAAAALDTLQVNVGKLCNMTCAHCHVDAGPDRKAENMSAATADAVLELLKVSGAGTLDLTGGAPEMNPQFRRMVRTARDLGRHVIDRCNLTILTAKGYKDLPVFLAQQGVEIVASLPCYTAENCDAQRGDGAFMKSVKALRLLNGLGYGSDPALPLTLVYNPVGPSLPPPQGKLEADYKTRLAEDFGVQFTRLFTITNMPIARYLDHLLETGKYGTYMEKLTAAFNPAAVAGLMCRTTLSVNWDGALSDCDFNQMLSLPLANADAAGPRPRNVHDAPAAELLDRVLNRPIVTGPHCFGCTAGAGSGCTGAIVDAAGA
ncbi:molybdenum cofactor biosynthesis protein A [Alienimonas californiensis]|uniref:Molybdenum cofactor biosynthesis protein A n=1 Tax=Alienimonas californiensis TaxID=2527989 RepID=A0A517P508_9PLAN|nr:molybdenum cofactor biosynthesis protein A [Alienimonas californiensis]